MKLYNYGEAVELLENGYRMARKSWNCNHMCIYKVEGSDVPFSKMKPEVQDALVCCRSEELRLFERDPVIHIDERYDMIASDGHIVCGWKADAAGILSDDWYIVQ